MELWKWTISYRQKTTFRSSAPLSSAPRIKLLFQVTKKSQLPSPLPPPPPSPPPTTHSLRHLPQQNLAINLIIPIHPKINPLHPRCLQIPNHGPDIRPLGGVIDLHRALPPQPRGDLLHNPLRLEIRKRILELDDRVRVREQLCRCARARVEHDVDVGG